MKKYLLFFAALLFAGLTLTSCDPNDVNGTKSALIGKWKLQSVDYIESASGNIIETYDQSAKARFFEFLSDGQFVDTNEIAGVTHRGRWELKQDLLIIYYLEGDSENMIVKEVTSKELIILAANSSTEYYLYHYARVL